MQLIIHCLTSHEKPGNKSCASNQGPIPHQAQIPKVSHTIALSRQEIKKKKTLSGSPPDTNGFH